MRETTAGRLAVVDNTGRAEGRGEVVGGDHAVVAPGATTATEKEGARTRRTPTGGTAKRPSPEYAKPRPRGACSAGLMTFENSRFSSQTVAKLR